MVLLGSGHVNGSSQLKSSGGTNPLKVSDSTSANNSMNAYQLNICTANSASGPSQLSQAQNLAPVYSGGLHLSTASHQNAGQANCYTTGALGTGAGPQSNPNSVPSTTTYQPNLIHSQPAKQSATGAHPVSRHQPVTSSFASAGSKPAATNDYLPEQRRDRQGSQSNKVSNYCENGGARQGSVKKGSAILRSQENLQEQIRQMKLNLAQ